MKLKTLFSTERKINTSRTVSIVSVALSFASVFTCYYLISEKMDSIWVSVGNQYIEVERQQKIDPVKRKLDYEEQTEKLVNYVYSGDAESYFSNEESYIQLMGTTSEGLIAKQTKEKVYNYLLENNSIAKVKIDSIHINNKSLPAIGFVSFIQTFESRSNSKDFRIRKVEIDFIIYDVNRWQKNRLGAKIDIENINYYDYE